MKQVLHGGLAPLLRDLREPPGSCEDYSDYGNRTAASRHGLTASTGVLKERRDNGLTAVIDPHQARTRVADRR